MGKSTISMAIFDSYVSLPEGMYNKYIQVTCYKYPFWIQGLHLDSDYDKGSAHDRLHEMLWGGTLYQIRKLSGG